MMQHCSQSVGISGGISNTVSVAVLLGLSCTTRLVYADVASCVSSHAAGQRAVKAGKLRHAAELFSACGSTEECPSAIRADCTELLREVERSTPTVIIAVADAQGQDVVEVRVSSAGEPLAESLDGRAVAMDPGKYNLKFEFPEGVVLHRDFLIREGEKNRILRVSLPDSESKQGDWELPPKTSMDSSDQNEEQAGLPMAFWISGGVGAVALASWGVFALIGHGRQSKLDECAPHCPDSRRDDYDAMQREYLVADISLGVAAASAGLATWFYLSDDNSPSNPDERREHAHGMSLSVVPHPSGAGVSLRVNTSAF